MLKDISNRAKGFYLLWVVFHLFLLFAVSDGIFKNQITMVVIVHLFMEG